MRNFQLQVFYFKYFFHSHPFLFPHKHLIIDKFLKDRETDVEIIIYFDTEGV